MVTVEPFPHRHMQSFHVQAGADKVTNLLMWRPPEAQTMDHTVNSCPLTKFEGGLTILHEAEYAVNWLNSVATTALGEIMAVRPSGINRVTQRRARLVLRWVTVRGYTHRSLFTDH